MFNHDSNKDSLSGVVAAALGAGIVTSFAVALGQSPLLALGITLFSALAAFLFDRLLQHS